MYRTILRRSIATFTKLGHDGTKTKIELKPSYPHKPKAVENLVKGLPELLKPAIGLTDDSNSTTAGNWNLDESGDTIHRHVSLQGKSEISSILQQIERAAEELNHDPHTLVDGTNLTISCTTHQPPGLSMKDVRLAQKVDAILKGFALASREDGPAMSVSDEQRKYAEQRNMEAVKRAKEDCSCG